MGQPGILRGLGLSGGLVGSRGLAFSQLHLPLSEHFFRYTLCKKEHMVVFQYKGTPPSYTGLLLIGTHPKRDP